MVNQNSKKEIFIVNQSNDIEYKQVNNKEDYIGELSDEEKQAEFNRKHEQYIKMKQLRKKELIKAKRDEFGTSSSDENESSNEEEIGEIKLKKPETKRSRGIISSKPSKQEQKTFSVVLELKKLNIDTDLIFLDKEFEINKKSIHYSRILKIAIFIGEGLS